MEPWPPSIPATGWLFPDPATGFASRPQAHVAGDSQEGRGVFNGWGAHCYVGDDPCSRENPCRDDYICVAGLTKGQEDGGVCVPPYFTFQFRVDGHPVNF